MYQVLARKWRPQRFDEVVGQQAVTRTLRNALASGRVHQAFVFAGPRGVGKTTTARLLARALNCVQGPTADPCGGCDACVEIAQGRDMDVLEIDAATHTGIDSIREVIISGLAITPVRDRYKIFIIDEVHQLSGPSFNALLKSIEEPPPHVVFIMATTEMQKIPDTILSRAQVFEFRAISVDAIAAQLRKIAGAEGLTVPGEALMLIARAAEGSMRDAQSALDQVIAFAGTTIGSDDVSTVLGLVGRDLLFDIVAAVVDEDAPAVFTLVGRAVDAGYDLRLVCRELARVVRDLLLVTVDPSRVGDPDVALEAERERIQALAAAFSKEDLLRSFDLLARGEAEVRGSAQPRYHLEIALLRWIHLRRLTPIEDVIAGLERGSLTPPPGRPAPPSPGAGFPRTGVGGRDAGRKPAGGTQATVARLQERRTPDAPNAVAQVFSPASGAAAGEASSPGNAAEGFSPASGAAAAVAAAPAPVAVEQPSGVPADLRDRVLAELKRAKPAFFGMVVAQAQAVEWDGRRLVFTFGPAHENLRQQIELRRGELEAIAEPIAGRRIPIVTGQGSQAASAQPPVPLAEPVEAPPPPGDDDLRARALSDSRVKALLEVIPAEIREVEDL